jgi:hypothetical protein
MARQAAAVQTPGYHEGEIAVQQRAGTHVEARHLVRMLDPVELVGGIVGFLAQQTLITLNPSPMVNVPPGMRTCPLGRRRPTGASATAGATGWLPPSRCAAGTQQDGMCSSASGVGWSDDGTSHESLGLPHELRMPVRHVRGLRQVPVELV